MFLNKFLEEFIKWFWFQNSKWWYKLKKNRSQKKINKFNINYIFLKLLFFLIKFLNIFKKI